MINNLHVYYNRYLLNKQDFICIIKKTALYQGTEHGCGSHCHVSIWENGPFLRAKIDEFFLSDGKASRFERGKEHKVFSQERATIVFQESKDRRRNRCTLFVGRTVSHHKSMICACACGKKDFRLTHGRMVPRCSYAVHTHNYQKVLYCVRGSIRFLLHGQSTESGGDTSIDLSSGVFLILPAGIPS